MHKTVSYLMCAVAFLALALSRELEPLVVGAVVVIGLGSWFVEPSRFDGKLLSRWTLVWNVLAILVFGACVFNAVRGDLLPAGVELICFLLVNKLMNRTKSRDYQHAYVLSFLMLVAGAALSSDLTYALCFLFYVVFATWTLTLFHLRREMEDNYLLKHSDDAQSERVAVERILNSRRIVGGSFLAGTALVSVGVSIMACVAFFLIPRFGFGFFAAHGRKAQPTVGFTDRVELGEYGQVQDNPQVVVRVELPAGPPTEPLHLRGVAFDHYQGGHWTRTARIEATKLVRRGRLAFVDPPTQKLSAEVRERILGGALEQRIYLDPLDTSVLFAASDPVAYELPPGHAGTDLDIEGRRGGEVYAVEGHVDVTTGHVAYTERKSAMRYTAYSRLGRTDLGRLLSDVAYTEIEPGPELRTYLAVPPLATRVTDLAKALVAGHKTRWAKAHAVEAYLRTRLRYTLDLKRDERFDPIEDFLFVQKAGHCEYFASAMALLLRSVGVPTRMVSGFYGGEWNQYGKYLAVRQRDAHAWVEVWVGGAGWVTFDPTPGGAAGAEESRIFLRMRLLMDTVQLAWFKYVIEYDLGKQVDLARSTGRVLSELGGGGKSTGTLERLRRTVRPGLVLALLCVLVVTLRRGRWRGSAAKVGDLHLAKAYVALEKRGLARGLGETARELARRAIAERDPGAEAFVRLVERCYAARYGSEAVDRAELAALVQKVVRPAKVARTAAPGPAMLL